jgi:hypothetical protein
MPGHVRDSLKEVDEKSWLIDDRLLLQRLASARYYLWKDSNGWHFTVSDVLSPLPETKPLSPDDPLKLVYDVGYASVAFDLGETALTPSFTPRRWHPFNNTRVDPKD